MAALTTDVTLTIAKVRGNGFEALEEPGKKYTVSQYVQPTPVIPEVGTRCSARVDARGFVHAIEPLEAPTNGHEGRQDAPTGPHSRDTTITRLAILKAAAEFCAARPDLKSGDVLRVAESWEGWVTR
jgi:hypothetical protein